MLSQPVKPQTQLDGFAKDLGSHSGYEFDLLSCFRSPVVITCYHQVGSATFASSRDLELSGAGRREEGRTWTAAFAQRM